MRRFAAETNHNNISGSDMKTNRLFTWAFWVFKFYIQSHSTTFNDHKLD